MAEITDNVLNAYDVLRVGNLRNGAIDVMVVTAREAAIPAEYFFSIPAWDDAWAGNEGAFEPSLRAATLVNVGIRTTFAKIVEAHVAAERAAYGLLAGPGAPAAAPFDEDAAYAAGRANADYRKRAIAHGSATAAGVYAYRLRNVDFNAAEVGTAIYQIDAPAPAGDQAAYNAAMASKTGGWRAALISGHDAAAYSQEERSAQLMESLTDVEREVSANLFILGTAAPPRAGAVHIKTTHHYLSDADNRRRHLACEKQVRAAESPEAKAWMSQNPEIWRDMLWHKSIHAVKVELLEDLAASPDTADRLEASGYGAFAVGIPAQEDFISRSSSYVAIRNATYDNIRASASQVDYQRLMKMHAVFLAMPRRLTGTVIAEWPGKPAGPPPAGVVTRKDAVMRWLKPELEACAARASWMFGWYREVCSRLSIRMNSQEGSLLRSYSLRKAMETHMPMAAEGQNAYTSYVRSMRVAVDDGKVVTFSYVDP